MKITRKTQRLFRLQQWLFYILLIAAVVLLSKVAIDTNQQFDWTANARHSLSEGTVSLLKQLDKPVKIEVFVSPRYEYHAAITSLLDRYQQYSSLLQVEYIDPARSPEKVRVRHIEQQGEMVISSGMRHQHVSDLSEQSLTNALLSVSREKDQWLVFIEGHEERSLFDDNDASLSTWAKQLQSQGLKVQAHNLATNPGLPKNTAAVVIASPVKDWLPGEVQLVKEYVAQGGNLLWLADPEQTSSLSGLAEQLGIEFIAGTVMDPNAKALGINDPRFVLIQDYANHPIGVATTNVSLFANVTALQPIQSDSETGWTYLNLLNSQPQAWVATGDLSEQALTTLRFNQATDLPGPVSIGFLLTREQDDDKQQRIAVLGDSDFATNAYIGTVANLDLAMATVNWLVNDDDMLTIPVKTSIGTQLNLSRMESMVMGFGFLVALPVLFFITGFVIWWRRRRR